MTLADLSSLGSFISGIAVLISLIYLSLQIRQNTKHSRALIQQGWAARGADSLNRWAELVWSDGMYACFAGASDVRASDLHRFIFLTRALFVGHEDSFLQQQAGLLDGPALESFEANARSSMASPGFRAAWKVLRHFFGSEFQVFMDQIVATTNAVAVTNQLDPWKAATAETASTVPG